MGLTSTSRTESAGEYFKDYSEDYSGPSDGSEFTIPWTPRGRKLVIEIATTWGDLHYVGLSGLEIFDASGRLISVKDPMAQIKAVPSSINDLEGYGADPRTVDKLFDGTPDTCDDLHAWLAPFSPHQPHTVTVTLDSEVTLGMLRVWNYNKSRIHAARGARHLKMTLDGKVIFQGEVGECCLNGP
jgi:hypothetical protein